MTTPTTEVIMTASSIVHRPLPLIAAAVAVVAIGAGSVAFSAAHDAHGPAPQPAVSVQEHPSGTHHHATTSGGRVQIGQ
jgi:hypothetical protein